MERAEAVLVGRQAGRPRVRAIATSRNCRDAAIRSPAHCIHCNHIGYLSLCANGRLVAASHLISPYLYITRSTTY